MSLLSRVGRKKRGKENREPGSVDEFSQLGSPMQHKAMSEKREMRDLNQRLEMFVKRQNTSLREVERLKQQLASQESAFREKLKDAEQHFTVVTDQLRQENNTLQLSKQTLEEQYEAGNQQREEAEARVSALEQLLTRKEAELRMKEEQLRPLQDRVKHLMQEMIKAQSSSVNETKAVKKLRSDVEMWRNKWKRANEELAQAKSRHNCEADTYQRTVSQLGRERDALQDKVRTMEKHRSALECKVRQEFDQKIQQFIATREEQYEQEKKEWMRIFKEEVNSKMQKYKEENANLSHANKKLEEDCLELRARNARVKKQKAEVEATLRAMEEDYERARSDLDELRLHKDEELKRKSALVAELTGRAKQEEARFQDLLSSKEQLDREIELYRKILSDAEKEAGYMSPLDGRKKRMTDGKAQYIATPGPTRGRHTAMKDVQSAIADESGPSLRNRRKRKHQSAQQVEEEMKDSESDFGATPGESYPIQFSTMDLCKSTLELQNVSEQAVSLEGYVLTNKERDCSFRLHDRILRPGERVKVVIGRYEEETGEEHIWWQENVWTGLKDDMARLYNPQNKEIARIEICPEMIPERLRSKQCLVM